MGSRDMPRMPEQKIERGNAMSETAMNTFGYDRITKQAEATITECMGKARQQAHPNWQQYIDWAFGVYLLWADLTGSHGDQRESDRERLAALVKELDPPK